MTQGFSSLTVTLSNAILRISKDPFSTPQVTKGIDTSKKNVEYITKIDLDFLGAILLFIRYIISVICWFVQVDYLLQFQHSLM